MCMVSCLLVCICIYGPRAFLVPEVARKKYSIPWILSYRWLWAVTQVMGMNLGPLGAAMLVTAEPSLQS